MLPGDQSAKTQAIFKIILNELYTNHTVESDHKWFNDKELDECMSIAKEARKTTTCEPYLRRALERSEKPGWDAFYASVKSNWVGIPFAPKTILMDATFMADTANYI